MTSSTMARAGGKVVQSLDETVRLHSSTGSRELGDEGADDSGAPALHHRPAVVVRERGEEPGEDAGEGRRQGQHGVGGGAGHERPPLLGTEAPGEMLGRGEPAQRKDARRDRMGRHVAHGAQKGRQDLVQVPDEGFEELGVGGPVCSERMGHVGDDGTDSHGAGPAEGMGEGKGRGQQADPAGGQIEVLEGGRGQQQRVHRRADVVAKAGQRQRGGAAAASGLVGSFVDVDRQAGAGQEERGNQPVGAGTHDDGIGRPHRCITASLSRSPRPP